MSEWAIGLVPKCTEWKKAHIYSMIISTHYFPSACLSVARLFADSVLRDQLLTNYSLRAASGIIIMKLETVTSPAADYECPFPGSGQCYHGIRQKTRFQAGWADRFEGMLTIAALKSPIWSSVSMMAKGYYVCVPVGLRLRLHWLWRGVLGQEPDGLTVRCQFTTPEMWVSSGHECRSIQFQTLNNIVQLPNIRDFRFTVVAFFFQWTEPSISPRKINLQWRVRDQKALAVKRLSGDQQCIRRKNLIHVMFSRNPYIMEPG